LQDALRAFQGQREAAHDRPLGERQLVLGHEVVLESLEFKKELADRQAP